MRRLSLLSVALLSALALKAPAAGNVTAAQIAQAIREAGMDPEECYRVRDLSYYKEDIKLYFHDGFLIFSKPVNGERLSAAFSADIEGGDGEVILFPPNPGERQSMARFTQSPNLDEHFRAALLIFSDETAQVLYDRITKDGAGTKAPEMGPLMADQWNSIAKNVTENFDIRLVIDLLHPNRLTAQERARQGLLFMAIAGKRLGSFDVLSDPRFEQQIMTGQIVDQNGSPRYQIWSNFSSRSFRTGASRQLIDEFTIKSYRINASILGNPADAVGVQGLNLKAVTQASLRMGPHAIRALPFEVSRAIHVTGARVDGQPAELLFRESPRGRALRPDQNDPFLVVAPDFLAPSTDHVVEFDHEGSVIGFAGKGVYFVQARSNWYPQNGLSFSDFDLTFRYPRALNLVAPGELKEETVDGEVKTSHYVTPNPIRLAGFNLGEYEKVSESGQGVRVDVYGNRHLEYALVPKAREMIVVPSAPGLRGNRIPSNPSTVMQTPAPPDPLGRLRAVAADISACFQYFTTLFGPPATNILTVAPVPASFGQGFPGLVYLSTIAYIDATERPPFARSLRDQVFFSDLIETHEVAHQWWGNVVVPAGYQDEWMTEGLSNYSALMWLEKKKGTKALEQVLEQYRDDLLAKDISTKTLESAGPITWGYRIESSYSANAWRVITYEKGSWIFHMLRKRLGDENFLKMLAEIRRRYEYKLFATEDLRTLSKEFLPPKVSKSTIDTFFDSWIYSTGIPTLKMNYSVKGALPQLRLSGTVDQTGVDKDFSAEVPIEIQFAKGPSQILWVETSDEQATFATTLKQSPVKVTLGIGTTVLAKK